MLSFNTNDKVSFSLYSGVNGVLEFSGTVIAVLTSDMASLYPGNALIQNHTNIWPMLPEEIKEQHVNSYTSYQYIALKRDTGELSFIGLPWIREETVVISNPRTVELTIKSFSENDGSRLTKVLEQYGYQVSSLKIVN